MVVSGVPVVLMDRASATLGNRVASCPDSEGGRRLLAVMVGDPHADATLAAAREMAAELWPWWPTVH